MNILEEMKKRLLFFDGGMGTLLQEAGLAPGELPELWNLSHPETVTHLHLDYLNAGCDIITANTFGANALKFTGDNTPTVEEVVSAAIANAKNAVTQCGCPSKYVALDMGPTGKLLKPLGDLDFEDAVSLYRQTVLAGAAAGADLILIETMGDTYEIKAAVLAAKEASDLPVFVTAAFDEQGTLLTGGSIPAVVALLEGLGVDALGLNCGLGPVQMKPLTGEFLKYASIPVIVNPNAGLPRAEAGKTVFDVGPEEFSSVMKEIAEDGARMLGGCCGTTPEHIRLMIDKCRTVSPVPVKEKNITVVSSYTKAVEIGPDPVIIGERINPTGKKKLKEALKSGDLEYILKEGLAQVSGGAHVLDVNVGLPDIDETGMMCRVISELQSVVDLPLQIDTSSPAAMEAALRLYNGKALINSVNGKAESMEQIFPLVKKYGGVVVALTLDESGIPETWEGRIAIAEKIYAAAASYGIAKKDILVDCLAMTISSDQSSALTTLETLRRVRDDLHGHTILGVSNISFGLPARPVINSFFFAMALQNGLNAAIVNPGSEDMMKAYHSFRALTGRDLQCAAFIEQYGGQPSPAASAQTGPGAADLSLKEAIIRGLKEASKHATETMIKDLPPLEIINSHLIPALDVVGKGFETKTMFLPQLLMSAEAAKAAFEVIKTTLAASGISEEKKGTVVIATVKGDIHDIGKNIVKILLENYSYQVIDLGRDVEPELIADTVCSTHAPLAGLSALMTTTVPSMEATIRLLRQRAPWCRVMVGGAVLTQEYADMIGADYYAKDAMASVHYAETVFSGNN
ncbi:homocysteine S-methyltransferase family protein [Lachnotalea sp. AF33-28]|uniref:homocysteine S-methyltransferase family protein n=1 Tax=Lachnotalea sp. AF33-28 TaxID=2292046 RepID=UPI000E4DB631|nr:homocysteine S-methyltransferase family protein [Lachnotalea sp. AF33-28]RHP30758.1 homocysteine methyltransferase [Lachnotalea sp. AF33-28]